MLFAAAQTPTRRSVVGRLGPNRRPSSCRWPPSRRLLDHRSVPSTCPSVLSAFDPYFVEPQIWTSENARNGRLDVRAALQSAPGRVNQSEPGRPSSAKHGVRPPCSNITTTSSTPADPSVRRKFVGWKVPDHRQRRLEPTWYAPITTVIHTRRGTLARCRQ